MLFSLDLIIDLTGTSSKPFSVVWVASTPTQRAKLGHMLLSRV